MPRFLASSRAGLGAAEPPDSATTRSTWGWPTSGVEQARLGRERQLEHHLPAAGSASSASRIASSRSLGCGAFGALDVHFGLDDRHQAVRQRSVGDLELLRDDRGDAGRVGELDHRAHLGPEHALPPGPREQRVEPGSASSAGRRSASSSRPLSTFRNGHDAASTELAASACRPPRRPSSSRTGSRRSPCRR